MFSFSNCEFIFPYGHDAALDGTCEYRDCRVTFLDDVGDVAHSCPFDWTAPRP